jgi:RIO kinase 1
MPRMNVRLFMDEDFEVYAGRPTRRHGRREKQGSSQKKARPVARLAADELADQADDAGSFDFSYHASRHEKWWLIDSLGGFYEGQWLRDVLCLVKGGKEASVYQCLAGVTSSQDRFLAAKVYRPRQLRNLKNDHLYREGRANLDAQGNEILDARMLRAMRMRTGYGQDLLHTSWIEHEYRALENLHTAGADVPIPYARGNNAVLMSYIGGPETPAPVLHGIDLELDEARTLFERVLCNIEIMLLQERVHGDLSAYNILYWEGQITLIDFPQVIHPQENRNAYQIFERDVTRVCEYFIRQGVRVNPRKLAADLWTSHRYHLGPDVHPGLLDDEDEADRAYWQRLQE